MIERYFTPKHFNVLVRDNHASKPYWIRLKSYNRFILIFDLLTYGLETIRIEKLN